MKENPSIPFSQHLAWSRDGLCGTWNRGASSYTCRRAQNMAPSRSLEAGKRKSGNLWAVINIRAQRPRAASIYKRICRPFLFCTRSVHNDRPHDLRPRGQATRHILLPSSKTHTTWLSRTVNGLQLAQYVSQFTSARIRESCHLLHATGKVHAQFMRRKASRNALFLQAISELRYFSTTCVPHSALVCSSWSPSDITEQPFHLRGMACSHETREGRASTCLTCLACMLLASCLL